MANASARVFYISDYLPDQTRPGQIKPSISSEPALSPREAGIDELYDISEPTGSFATTARSRFASIASSLHAAKTRDAIDRDEAVMSLQAELPRSFALDGWSDGALAIITALHHGLRNRKGQALDATQYLRVYEAVTALRDKPFLRFEPALDVVDALQNVGLETDPEEALILQAVFND
jgi:hypothetical protein